MKKSLKIVAFCAFAASTSMGYAAIKPVTIGIVVPIAIPAMTQIVSGLETTLKKDSKTPVKFLVKNAQGDANIQRSILEEFNSPSVDMVAPIGTDASQMAIAMIRNKPIIGIAADHLEQNAKKANNTNVTGVNSRTPVSARVDFMHDVLPNIKHFTLIYSADAHVFPQVQEATVAANKDHMLVQKLMVAQLSDLYTVSKNIKSSSQAIFILKDEPIVSGINTLLQQAKAKNIPVIASDDGSVAKGAAFALGVSEYQTGVDAAKVVMKIMNGAKAGSMPVHMMTHYFVFIKPSAAKSQRINPATIKAAAKKAGYKVNIL